MSEAAPEILILGLGETGASIGLALRSSGIGAERVGYDRDRRASREALRAGAVDRVGAFPSSARRADLIILALSAAEVPDTLQAMGSSLQAEAVILDTALPTSSDLERVQSRVPAGRHYLIAVPSLAAPALAGPPAAASADLFRGGQLALVLPPGTPESVARLAFHFGGLLGSAPYFIDPAELAGVAASTEALPALTAAALIRTASRAPNWREAERLAGRVLGVAASLLTWQDPGALAANLSVNRDNVLAKLDGLLEELSDLRNDIARLDERALLDKIGSARRAYEAWIADRARDDWREKTAVSTAEESSGGLLRQLFLPRLPRRDRDR